MRKTPTRAVHALAALLAGIILCGPAAAQTREYWIAADEVAWDYPPRFPSI